MCADYFHLFKSEFFFAVNLTVYAAYANTKQLSNFLLLNTMFSAITFEFKHLFIPFLLYFRNNLK